MVMDGELVLKPPLRMSLLVSTSNIEAGGFKVYPELAAANSKSVEQGDHPAILSLDPENSSADGTTAEAPALDFSSTLGSGSLTLISSWAKECATSHTKCHKVFWGNGLTQTAPLWFPDRLIRITRAESADDLEVTITARVVLKSDSSDFPSDKSSAAATWGPAPDLSAPLGGRDGCVLTESTLPAWRKDLPLDDLPLTFQHAVMVCTQLGFEYIWIDSLCILQDSREDWESQSAVMGDVYKFAWLNIAALDTKSDYEGFINESRDSRVEFGFRAPFASILGRSYEERNIDGQECILLRGKAKLLFSSSFDAPGRTVMKAPLFSRAWVFQERDLARRTLAFSRQCVHWGCDEYGRSEDPINGGFEGSSLRTMLHLVLDKSASSQGAQRSVLEERAWELLGRFDMHWSGCVTSYTLCKLTKHSDKLIAISSVARELANSKVMPKRYLAGLWDINLPFQMSWITVEGRETPARKRLGDAEYVAPSWSWASIEAPVQPQSIFRSGLVALADVHATDVALKTDYAFGAVKAGWLRVSGHLNRVKSAKSRQQYSWDEKTRYTLLMDEKTGEELAFCPDTVEGYEMVNSRKGARELLWMPLTLRFSANMLECRCMCLVQVKVDEDIGMDYGFVKAGERVYRRVGSGDFGRIPSMLRQNKLLLGLGTYSDVQGAGELGEELKKGFKRRDDGLEDFILI
ncbi:hypothetical protein LSUE1_G000165 [Lachnellula suecica]|uniref:Heterokaryon incompatibility domain-containing protein n=1 Tax=Lachnellula suecica TaxID=602035 RepID=A0A8T9CMR3_9HELO|nr:hypothetical protein LSUE1_G000165 [Lachnellula suecica]